MGGPMFDLTAMPIREDAPGGDSVREDERYDRLEEYFQGFDAVPWDEVIRLATSLLGDVGKDVKVTARLGVGLFEERSWSGLADAYSAWSGLLSEGMWPHVQPKRPRGQASAIGWFAERVSEQVKEAQPVIADLETLRSLRTAAKEVELLIDERMGDKAPQMVSISRLVRNHVEQLELDAGVGADASAAAEQTSSGGGSTDALFGADPYPMADPFADPPASSPAPEPQDASEEESSSVPPPAAAASAAPKVAEPVTPKSTARPASVKAPSIPSAPAEGGGLKEGEKAFRQLKDPILQTLELIRRAAPERAAPYSLARDWVWGLASSPPAKAGKTSIPAPGTRDITLWEAMASKGEWAELLHSSEGRWPKTIFWLDPHRYVGLALSELGLDAAHSAVAEGVARLLERLPGLEELTFSDGTPVADEDTRAWLKKHASSTETSSPASTPVPMPALPLVQAGGGALSLPEETKNLIESGKLMEAVLGFESTLVAVADRRSKFNLKVQLAQALAAAGDTQTARPILEALDEEVERFELETWEPSLARATVQTLLAVLVAGSSPDSKTPEFAERLLLLRTRLARLDALAALAGSSA